MTAPPVPSVDDPFAGRSTTERLVRIAVPLTLSAAFRYAVDLSNVYWIGKLGVVALSIVTALGTFLSLSKMFGGITSAGTSAVVGRLMGEGRTREAVRVAQKVTGVSLLLGAVVAALAFAASGPALDVLDFGGAERREAERYLAVLLVGLPFAFGVTSMTGALVGLGRPRESMLASSAAIVVAFVLTPTLVAVLRVGVYGAAVAQVVGDVAAYLTGLWLLRRVAGEGHLPFAKRFRKLEELLPVVRIGLPLTFDAAVHGGVWFALVAFLANYGSEFVAAQGTEERFTQILNLPTEGIAPAAATLVGYFVGQGKRREALRVVWTSLGAVACVSVCGALFLRLSPAPVVAWLCNDPEYVDVGVRVLSVAAIGLAFLGTRDVMEAAFGGVSRPIPPVAIGLVIALSRFPLAWLLAVRLGQGGLGVTLAVNSTLVVQALVLVVWFRARFATYEVAPLAPLGLSVPPPATASKSDGAYTSVRLPTAPALPSLPAPELVAQDEEG